MVAIILFFVLHWYLSLFTQSFFYHRYAAHGAFTMNKFWEKTFYVVSYVFQGSSYLSPRTYAILHRAHHAYTDTEKDPHSPKYFGSIFTMMWATAKVYMDLFKQKIHFEERFEKNLPNWKWLDNFGHTWFSRILWTAAYVAFYIIFAPSAWFYLLLPIQIVMGPFHGAIINWFAHKYGNTKYAQDNTSKNLFRVDILMLGESYHNNHHKYPSSINFGKRWYEIDPLYPVILFFNWIGIIKVKSPALAALPSEF